MDLILDNTMLSAWDVCPTKYYWRHIRHLVPQASDNIKMNFGIAIHRFLETYYKGGTFDESSRSFLAAFQTSTPDGHYTPENGLTIMDQYIKKWTPEQWKVRHVEVNLQWELSSDLIYCGRADLVVEWFGDIYVADHKSSARIENFCARPNHQLSGYVVGTKVLGLPVVGGLVNLIAVLSPNTKIPIDRRFRRILTPRTEFELNDWRLHVLTVREEIQRSLDSGRFERKTTQCSWCPFAALCNSTPDVVEAVASSLYRQEPWQPWLEHREEEG